MDINCTYACAYQNDGKCGMQGLPVFSQTLRSENKTDCPYYTDIKQNLV